MTTLVTTLTMSAHDEDVVFALLCAFGAVVLAAYLVLTAKPNRSTRTTPTVPVDCPDCHGSGVWWSLTGMGRRISVSPCPRCGKGRPR